MFAASKAQTHLEAAVDDADEGAGDVEAPLDLGDGALHVRAAEGFGEVHKRQRGQEELENTQDVG